MSAIPLLQQTLTTKQQSSQLIFKLYVQPRNMAHFLSALISFPGKRYYLMKLVTLYFASLAAFIIAVVLLKLTMSAITLN